MTEQELILTKILDCERIGLYVDQKVLTAEQEHQFQRIQERRRSGEPLQYLLGECEFMGLKFKVDPRVLIPRPETELLVYSILEKIKEIHPQGKISILDLGTGSGNISVSLAKFLNCSVTAVDISREALDLANENAAMNHVAGKINFVHADLKDFLEETIHRKEKFDIIVSNPPYIETGKLDSLPMDVRHEPRLALNGGEDGLDFYRAILAKAQDVLTNGGLIFFEIGDGQDKPLEKICSEHFPFAKIEFQKDYMGTERIIILNKTLNSKFEILNKSK